MARPRCMARVRGLPATTVFKPRGVPARELSMLALGREELEALKLADLLGLYHAEAAARMGVSRPTFGRILAAGRRKTAAALVLGKGLEIAGGHYRNDRGGTEMKRIAVATDEQQDVSRHFGRSTAISVFEVEGDQIGAPELRPLPHRSHGAPGEGHGHGGRGHGWIEPLVAGCDAIVVGGIGSGARDMLSALGLRVILAERGEAPDAAALRAAATPPRGLSEIE